MTLTKLPITSLLTAAIALHVADDSFFQPQPGTSAGITWPAAAVVAAVVIVLAIWGPRSSPVVRMGDRPACPDGLTPPLGLRAA